MFALPPQYDLQFALAVNFGSRTGRAPLVAVADDVDTAMEEL